MGGVWKEGKSSGVRERGEGNGEGPRSMLTYSEAAGGVIGADGLRERGIKFPKEEDGFC